MPVDFPTGWIIVSLTMNGGAMGLLFWVGRLLYLGKLATRRELDDVRADRDKRVSEQTQHADQWHSVAVDLLKLARTREYHTGQLLESGRVVAGLAEALPLPTAGEGPP